MRRLIILKRFEIYNSPKGNTNYRVLFTKEIMTTIFDYSQFYFQSQIRCVSRFVRLSVTLLKLEWFSHYPSRPICCDWVAVSCFSLMSLHVSSCLFMSPHGSLCLFKCFRVFCVSLLGRDVRGGEGWGGLGEGRIFMTSLGLVFY